MALPRARLRASWFDRLSEWVRHFAHATAKPRPIAMLPPAPRCDCRYERVLFGKTLVTACVYCHRPPPTSMPSAGVPMLG